MESIAYMPVLELRRPCCDKRAALSREPPVRAEAHRVRHAQLYHVSARSVQLQYCLCRGVQVGVSCHKERDESAPAPPPSTTQLVPALSCWCGQSSSISPNKLELTGQSQARCAAPHLHSQQPHFEQLELILHTHCTLEQSIPARLFQRGHTLADGLIRGRRHHHRRLVQGSAALLIPNRKPQGRRLAPAALPAW